MNNFTDGLKKGAEGYSPAVMWFYTGNVDLREMTRQLEGFKKNGIVDFFIHPVNRCEGDYLGEHYFRAIKHVVKEAKRLGLKYWIYDEYNWPSGVVGGHLLRRAPWAKMSCVCKYSMTAKPGETIRLALPDFVNNNTKPLFFSVDGEEVKVRLFGDIAEWTNTSSEEKTLDAFVSKWMRQLHYNTLGSDVSCPEEGYLDTLDPEAVQLFIDMTHEVYKKNIGDEFGKAVRGVFTDEVPLSYVEKQPEDFVGMLMPWTRKFEEKFLERNGYDIKPKLPALFSGKDAKLLIDYWETITHLFITAYMDMTYNWCTENNLIYTGHLLYEEEINKDIVYSGDPYECYKRFTWPGVDTICTFYRINDYSFNITAKMGSSALRFAGKERLMCEAFTISGWFIRLRDMKRVFNRLALNGVTFIQYMGAQYDLKLAGIGSTMTNNWQNPLFKHYDKMTTYISGVQNIVANSTFRARALVYYPLTTGYTLVNTRPPYCTTTVEMDRTLQGLTNALLQLNTPFEFGYAQVIDEDATVNGGVMTIKGTDYDVIILPCAKYIKETTWKKIMAFAQGGGRVIAVNGSPEFIVSGDDIVPAEAIPGMIEYTCTDFDIIIDPTRFDYDKIAPMGAFANALKDALKGLPDRVYHIEPVNGIMSGLFQKDDMYYAMVINDNKEITPVRGRIAGDTPFRVISADLGGELPVKVSGREFEFDLEAYSCAFIEIGKDVKAECILPFPTEGEAIAIENVRFIPQRQNAYLPVVHRVKDESIAEFISAWKVSNPHRIAKAAEALTEDELILCRRLFNKRNPLEGAPDWYGWHPVDNDFGKPGQTVVCTYDFILEEVPEVLDMLAEAQDDTFWYLNGERLYQTGTARIWHYANQVYDLTGVAVPGKNRLVGICTFPSVEHLDYTMPAAVIKGDFRVFNEPELKITTRPGENDLYYWNDQGYYFYTGDGLYTADFTAKAGEKVYIRLETTDVAEVFVNGTSAGRMIWDPYCLEITDLIKDGENKLEIMVTSTAANLIHGQTPSGVGNVKLFKA